MIRFIIDIIVIVLCFLFQQTAFQALPLNGIVPNILLIITVVYGIISGSREGMWVGFLSGLLVDIFYGDIIGINALIYLLIGHANGYFKGGFFPEDIKMPLVLIAINDFIFSAMYYAINFLPRGRLNFPGYLKTVCLPEIVFTVLLSLIVYKPLMLLLTKTNFNESELS